MAAAAIASQHNGLRRHRFPTLRPSPSFPNFTDAAAINAMVATVVSQHHSRRHHCIPMPQTPPSRQLAAAPHIAEAPQPKTPIPTYATNRISRKNLPPDQIFARTTAGNTIPEDRHLPEYLHLPEYRHVPETPLPKR
ncbi:hypothetical protein KSP39_PZI009181 [Platanthera zijinensis]|uniref:Uncharacterized protein n=1 Tax=Platanthera zijinensis TaxID=2320716 RepID=A0AAP0G7Y1_9ASPA